MNTELKNIFGKDGKQILDLSNWTLYVEKVEYEKGKKSFYYIKNDTKDTKQVSIGVFYDLKDLNKIDYIAWGYRLDKDCSYNAKVGDNLYIEKIVAGCPCDEIETKKNCCEAPEKQDYLSKKYLPIYCFLVLTILLSLTYIFIFTTPSLMNFMSAYMSFFFLIFGGIKLFNLKGFAKMFSTYDLIAERFPTWGYVYPFVEIILGLLYLNYPHTPLINVFTAILMAITSLGIYRHLKTGKVSQCACLGGFFNVPLSWVTFWENFIMLLMALYMLLI